jgi:hypothetical protein
VEGIADFLDKKPPGKGAGSSLGGQLQGGQGQKPLTREDGGQPGPAVNQAEADDHQGLIFGLLVGAKEAVTGGNVGSEKQGQAQEPHHPPFQVTFTMVRLKMTMTTAEAK